MPDPKSSPVAASRFGRIQVSKESLETYDLGVLFSRFTPVMAVEDEFTVNYLGASWEFHPCERETAPLYKPILRVDIDSTGKREVSIDHFHLIA